MTDGLFAGRYRLAERLGTGGMARVHRAQDTRMGRTVAVKTLLPDLADNPDARRRFAREAQAAGALNHPGIVTVHDQDEIRDGDEVVPYLVMEFVPGGTLAQLLRRQVMFTPERAVRVTCDILDALAHAHSRGTVHRDVKPANVMVTPEGVVKVADFGIARVLDTDSRLTTTGSAVGTPSYMSPEQINGAEVDARSDVYSVGCVLTELLTGKPPFTDGNPINLMYWHVHSAPPAPSSRNPRIPAELDGLVLTALAKDPAARHPDAAAFRDRLRDWLVSANHAALLAGPALPPGEQPAPPALPDKPPSTPQAPNTPPPAPPNTPAGTPPTPQPSPFGEAPGPSTPPPATPAEHPAYALRPQVPLPPPYLPNTPPPFGPANSGEFDPARRARRRWITAVAAVAVAAVAVTVTLLYGPLGGGKGDKADDNPTTPPTGTHRPTPTRTAAPAALARHGGKEGSGFNGGMDAVVHPSDRRGGTLKLAASLPEDGFLDPAMTYEDGSWNLQRLYLRKLVDYAPEPGAGGRVLKPDLATDTGTVSNGGKTWTFTLKPGLEYENGDPITSQDVKYGIERSFARDVFPGGPTYFVDLLDEGQNYQGPYKDGSGLRSITTPDDRTVVFTLAKPFSDFRYLLAMPMAAPVPSSADGQGGKAFRDKPLSSGPYKITDYTANKSLHMVRNPHWDQASDPIRSALPDAVDLTLYDDQEAVTQALISGSADADVYARSLTGADTSRVLADPDLKASADVAYDGTTHYLALETQVAPFTNSYCRKAVQYAVDRAAVRTARGGEYLGGDVATGMLPPVVDGYDSGSHPYGDSTGKPDTAKAKEMLAKCGKPSGFQVTLVSAEGSTAAQNAQVVQQSLRAVGISVRIQQVTSSSLYSTLADPAKTKSLGWGMVLTGWLADYPTGGGFLNDLVRPGSPSNFSRLDDPTLTGYLDSGEAATDPGKAAEQWAAADAKVMDDAALVPLVWGRRMVLHSSRLTNVYEHEAFGGVDLTALGVEP
jgi:peptide/nickel transport system substrate-binding protein